MKDGDRLVPVGCTRYIMGQAHDRTTASMTIDLDRLTRLV
jgi:hypothetical protein